MCCQNSIWEEAVCKQQNFAYTEKEKGPFLYSLIPPTSQPRPAAHHLHFQPSQGSSLPRMAAHLHVFSELGFPPKETKPKVFIKRLI